MNKFLFGALAVVVLLWGCATKAPVVTEVAEPQTDGTGCSKEHEHADHVHGPKCGHKAISHDGHKDYGHDSHADCPHSGHCDVRTPSSAN